MKCRLYLEGAFLTDFYRCDAEPIAFAKYVLALLKKDSSEDKLRSICEEQLDVFLGANTKEFVDSLFDALKNRTYLSSPGSPVEEVSENIQNAGIFDVHEKPSESGSRLQRRRISPPREKEEFRSKHSPRRRRSRSRSRSPYQRRRGYTGRDRYRSRSRSRSPYRYDLFAFHMH